MNFDPNDDPDDWVIPPLYWRWLGSRWTVLTVLWIITLAVTGARIYAARTMFETKDDPPEATLLFDRPSGNHGHTEIDFGGQWIMGRMVLEGHADELYDRNRIWEVAWKGYPIADEPPAVRDGVFPGADRPTELTGDNVQHDAENLLLWMMGGINDSPRREEVGPIVVTPFGGDAIAGNPFATAALTAASNDALTPDLLAELKKKSVGGPLYPPIHGFFYAPLTVFDPPLAYAILQYLLVALTFPAGYAASVITRGRIPWPAATLVILLFPGVRSGFDLAQNPSITLAILLIGWACVVRGRDGLGGMVWGLLAFKPVWAAAFFLVPLLMRRWRFCLAMVGTGILLGAATLPFTGIEVWLDWLKVGNEASSLYQTNKNWIALSRDLHGIPRRLMLDFDLSPEAKRLDTPESWWANIAGWSIWGFVFTTTALLYLLRGNRRSPTGLGAGFLFLGAWLCCYRFMYYDSALAVIAFFVLFANPGGMLRSAVYYLFAARSQPPLSTDLRPIQDLGEQSQNCFARRSLLYLNSFPLSMLLLLIVCENWILNVDNEVTVVVQGVTLGDREPMNLLPPTAQITTAVSYFHPWDTLLLLLVWLWAGVKLAIFGDAGDEPPSSH